MSRISTNLSARICRSIGWLVGAGAQLMFAATVVRLYQFLAEASPVVTRPALGRDVALALLFAAPHSVVRLPRIQKATSRRIGREFFGIFYCWMTCLSLWIVFAGWQASATAVWELHGFARTLVLVAFQLSWAALAYSLWLTGIGYQTGFTEWNHWRRREAVPPRKFVPTGAYRWLRHPVYLSFLGLVWFNPRMTVDHLVLALVWTAYIAVGSYLKDERLAFYMGEEYRRYQARVPGYPLVRWGPLGLRGAGDAEPRTQDLSPSAS